MMNLTAKALFFIALVVLVAFSAFKTIVFAENTCHLHSPFTLLTCLLGNIYLFASIGFIRFVFLVPVCAVTFDFHFNFIF